jgi:two-component system, NarL family, invasion response regulator UvrY
VTNTWHAAVATDGPRDAGACGVLVVDDHDEFRRSARAVVEATEHFALVGEASSGEESVELAALLAPDLVVMDVRMPGMGGVEAARRVRAILPAAVIVLISVDVTTTTDGLPGVHGAGATMPKHALSPNALEAIWRRHRPGGT